MHPDAPFVALLTDLPAHALPASVSAVWRRRGALQIRDLFEWEPAALAEALAIPEDALAPLLALRAGLPRARTLIQRLTGEGISLVTVGERAYPSALRDALGDEAPRALWLAGARDPLSRGPIAIVGEREAPDDAVGEASDLARAAAGEGHSVLTGVATPIERAVLRAALAEPGGTAIGLSHYGIARALPNLQPWRQAIREGRFLLLSHAQPEAPWEPGREELGGAVLAGLADRLVLVQGGRPATADRCARLALGLGRPVFIRPRDEATAATLLAEGARVLSEPLGADLVAALPARRGAVAAEPTISSSGLNEEGAPPNDLEEMVLRYLNGRRKPAGKGALLHALAIEEGVLDRALMRLMARGDVTQHSHRTGVAYTVTGAKGTGTGAFQLSIFGLDQET